MCKNIVICLSLLFLISCAQDPYRLKINNDLQQSHGKSIYFRSNMRSSYAGSIRNVLSKKFAESGMKTATSAANADLIGIFDIENFYPQSDNQTTFISSSSTETPLFTSDEESTSLDYSGNTDMKVTHEQTCFTLKIGQKDTSMVKYNSSFCAGEIYETEEMVPYVTDVYAKYGNYERADIGVQCINRSDDKPDCNPVHDRQQAFINSLWIDRNITE